MSAAVSKNMKLSAYIVSLGMAATVLASCGATEQSGEESMSGGGSEDSMMMDSGSSTMMESSGMMADEMSGMTEAEGLVSAPSEYGFDETVDRLTQNVEDGGNMVVATVDHASAAEGIGEELRPTTLLIFGNPAGGTPLMQATQSIGIDLPQKALVWEDADGQVWLSYNDPAYLAERHGLTGMDEMISTISTNLQNLVESTTGGEGSGTMSESSMMESSAMESSTMMEESSMMEGMSSVPGLVTTQSEASFDETVSGIEADIESRGLNLVATVDHSANAASVDEDLRPTTLFVFGNPEAGTPLMQAAQTAGIDLPQKMLVWEDEFGAVNVSYNDPQYVAERHGLSGVEDQLEAISGVLDSIAASGSGMMESSMMMDETTGS